MEANAVEGDQLPAEGAERLVTDGEETGLAERVVGVADEKWLVGGEVVVLVADLAALAAAA